MKGALGGQREERDKGRDGDRRGTEGNKETEKGKTVRRMEKE